MMSKPDRSKAIRFPSGEICGSAPHSSSKMSRSVNFESAEACPCAAGASMQTAIERTMKERMVIVCSYPVEIQQTGRGRGQDQLSRDADEGGQQTNEGEFAPCDLTLRPARPHSIAHRWSVRNGENPSDLYPRRQALHERAEDVSDRVPTKEVPCVRSWLAPGRRRIGRTEQIRPRSSFVRPRPRL